MAAKLCGLSPAYTTSLRASRKWCCENLLNPSYGLWWAGTRQGQLPICILLGVLQLASEGTKWVGCYTLINIVAENAKKYTFEPAPFSYGTITGLPVTLLAELQFFLQTNEVCADHAGSVSNTWICFEANSLCGCKSESLKTVFGQAENETR